MLFLYAIVCGILAAALTYCLNWWALRAWRKAANEHWTERARLLFPARRNSFWQLLLLGAIASLSTSAFFVEPPRFGIIVLVLTMAGGALGTYPMVREIRPGNSFRDWIKDIIGTWLLFFGVSIALVVCIIFMPPKFGLEVWLYYLLLVGFICWLHWGGALLPLRKLGIIEPAPEQLRHLVERVSLRMNIRVRQTWLWHSSMANAMAFPVTGDLIFTGRLLETMPTEEQEAVCAHELGHLSESRGIAAIRILGSLAATPVALLTPTLSTYRLPGIAVLLCLMVVLIKLSQLVARKMEVRADTAATQDSSGVIYARALERLYEINQMPAVMPGNNQVHPHLYDRMLAAGITPAYGRPKAPVKLTEGLVLLLVLLVVTVMNLYLP